MSFDLLERLQAPSQSETVVISRAWSHPEITVTINREKIVVMASLDDFISGLIEELKVPDEPKKLGMVAGWLLGDVQVSSPAKKVTADAIRAAAAAALEKIKEATSQVM